MCGNMRPSYPLRQTVPLHSASSFLYIYSETFSIEHHHHSHDHLEPFTIFGKLFVHDIENSLCAFYGWFCLVGHINHFNYLWELF